MESKKTLPKSIKAILVISFIIYIWYFISSLIIPLSKFIPLSEPFLITIEKMVSFPISLLAFVLCVSIISTVIVLIQFSEQKYATKLLLIESASLLLYYIVPIVATLLILVLVISGTIHYFPSVSQIAEFLEDLFIFTTFLFTLNAILNIAMQRIIKIK